MDQDAAIAKLNGARDSQGQVRGRHFSEWAEEIATLKREKRLDEALVLLAECMNATERQDAVGGYGCPAPHYYEQAAIIHRGQRNFDAEVEVLGRYLRVASEAPSARPRIEARFRKAWLLSSGSKDAMVPAAASGAGLAQELQDSFELEDEKARKKAEKQSRKWLSQPVLTDDLAESRRRSAVYLPSTLLNKGQWRRDALSLTGENGDSIVMVDALLDRADRWGVLDPDTDEIRAVFPYSDDGSMDMVDLRTGELIPNGMDVLATKLWLSAATGASLREVDRVLFYLNLDSHPILSFWEISGDLMDGKAELRLLSDLW